MLKIGIDDIVHCINRMSRRTLYNCVREREERNNILLKY